MVPDDADGEGAVVEAAQLPQGSLAVEQARFVAAAELDPGFGDVQLVALRGQ